MLGIEKPSQMNEGLGIPHRKRLGPKDKGQEAGRVYYYTGATVADIISTSSWEEHITQLGSHSVIKTPKELSPAAAGQVRGEWPWLALDSGREEQPAQLEEQVVAGPTTGPGMPVGKLRNCRGLWGLRKQLPVCFLFCSKPAPTSILPKPA